MAFLGAADGARLTDASFDEILHPGCFGAVSLAAARRRTDRARRLQWPSDFYNGALECRLFELELAGGACGGPNGMRDG